MKDYYLGISEYFIHPDYRTRVDERLSDGSGVKLSWGLKNSYSNIIRYTEWLHSVIKLSSEIDIPLVKTIELMKEGVISKLGWSDECEFIDIFLKSIKNDGSNDKITILSKNSRTLD